MDKLEVYSKCFRKQNKLGFLDVEIVLCTAKTGPIRKYNVRPSGLKLDPQYESIYGGQRIAEWNTHFQSKPYCRITPSELRLYIIDLYKGKV